MSTLESYLRKWVLGFMEIMYAKPLAQYLPNSLMWQVLADKSTVVVLEADEVSPKVVKSLGAETGAYL